MVSDRETEMIKSAKKREMTKRILLYFLGTVIMAFGVTMAVRADIGVAPGSTISYALFKLTPLSLGQCSASVQIACMLLQLIMTRRMTLKLLFQFPMAYVFGLIIDAFYFLLDIAFVGYLYRVLFLLGGLVVFSLGIRILVGADILLAPTDGLALALGNLFGWPMSKGKLAFDIIITLGTAILTLIAVGDFFLVVGIGTVICAIGTGPIIGFFTKLFPFFDAAKETPDNSSADHKNGL